MSFGEHVSCPRQCGKTTRLLSYITRNKPGQRVIYCSALLNTSRRLARQHGNDNVRFATAKQAARNVSKWIHGESILLLLDDWDLYPWAYRRAIAYATREHDIRIVYSTTL